MLLLARYSFFRPMQQQQQQHRNYCAYYVPWFASRRFSDAVSLHSSTTTSCASTACCGGGCGDAQSVLPRPMLVRVLYKQLLKESSKMPIDTRRTWLRRRIREEFKKHRADTDESEIDQNVMLAQVQLDSIVTMVNNANTMLGIGRHEPPPPPSSSLEWKLSP